MKKIVIRIIALVLISALPVMNSLGLTAEKTAVPAAAKADVSPLYEFSEYDVKDIERNIRELDRIRQEEEAKKQLEAEELARLEEEKRLEQERLSNYNSLMEQLADGTVTYRQLFKDTLIVGDSLMHGLYTNGILDNSSMITMVSASLYHLESNLGKIVAGNPRRLILHYGINMLVNTDSQLNWFIEMYGEILSYLCKELPDTEIYVSGIFNVSDSKVNSYPGIERYNEQLEALCNELQVNYVDNSELLPGDGSYYGSDGVHLSRAFYYDVWLPHMYYVMSVKNGDSLL